MAEKKYKLLVAAAGFPAGAVVSGAPMEVLVANGKAVEVVDEPKKKEGKSK